MCCVSGLLTSIEFTSSQSDSKEYTSKNVIKSGLYPKKTVTVSQWASCSTYCTFYVVWSVFELKYTVHLQISGIPLRWQWLKIQHCFYLHLCKNLDIFCIKFQSFDTGLLLLASLAPGFWNCVTVVNSWHVGWTWFSGWLVAWFLHCSCCTADLSFCTVL